MTEIDYLKIRFQRLCKKIKAKPTAIDKAWENLRKAYEKPPRFYHTLSFHIATMLRALTGVKAYCADIKAIKFAIFYHDALPTEEKTATFAEEEMKKLGIDPNFVSVVKKLIIATKHNKKQTDRDCCIICDIDLLGLAYSKRKFDNITARIRQEHPNVSDEFFWKDRKQFFKKLLEKDVVFQHPFFKKYENNARKNLTTALEEINKILAN